VLLHPALDRGLTVAYAPAAALPMLSTCSTRLVHVRSGTGSGLHQTYPRYRTDEQAHWDYMNELLECEMRESVAKARPSHVGFKDYHGAPNVHKLVQFFKQIYLTEQQIDDCALTLATEVYNSRVVESST
jgi:hypothetical protein